MGAGGSKPPGKPRKTVSFKASEYICTPCDIKGTDIDANAYCKQCQKQFCDACQEDHRARHKDHAVLGQDGRKEWGKVEKGDGKDSKDKVNIPELSGQDPKAKNKETRAKTVVPNNVNIPELSGQDPKAKNEETRDKNVVPVKNLDSKEVEKNNGQVGVPELKGQPNIANLDLTNGNHEARPLTHKAATNQQPRNGYGKVCRERIKQWKEQRHNEISDDKKVALDDIFDKFLMARKAKEKLIQRRENREKVKRYAAKVFVENLTKANQALEKQPQEPKYNLYQVISHKKYSMVKDDEDECEITGVCQLPSGNIVLIDWCNEYLKLLDGNFDIIARCGHPDPYNNPIFMFCVCHVRRNVFAISGGNGIVQFRQAQADGKSLLYEIHFEHECLDIDCKNDILYISSRNAIYKYSLKGERVGTLYYGDVHRFAVSKDGTTIYVTHFYSNTLTTLNKTGETIATYDDPVLKGCHDVCIGERDSVFVCYHDSDAVILVAAGGVKKLATIATRSHGVSEPLSMCFNRSTSQLIVCQKDSDNLLVLTLYL